MMELIGLELSVMWQRLRVRMVKRVRPPLLSAGIFISIILIQSGCSYADTQGGPGVIPESWASARQWICRPNYSANVSYDGIAASIRTRQVINDFQPIIVDLRSRTMQYQIIGDVKLDIVKRINDIKFNQEKNDSLIESTVSLQIVYNNRVDFMFVSPSTGRFVWRTGGVSPASMIFGQCEPIM
ncbi:hypothetical protein E9232_003382 [Inquilinus ginsengisoli]|uniref:Uncharacterized protein n=1 Tax=Inquilinus ginsengisoli TaxID=363840 RepID=A0ABU1JQG3_9PROT|nr:hypothetical protein [Inquilinus ginsengisoli]MDR6290856.1 hypothetical protein [Inquilinus ginsengisoli]